MLLDYYYYLGKNPTKKNHNKIKHKQKEKKL